MADIIVGDEQPRRVYQVGSEAQSEFTVPFPFLADTDVKVAVNAGTADHVLDLGADYTVSGAGSQTGTVTLTTPVSDCTVTVYRELVIERSTRFPAAGTLKMPALNREFDRATMIAQQLADRAKRSLSLAASDDLDTNATLPVAQQRSNRLFVFDAEGRPVMSDATVQQVEGTAIASWAQGNSIGDVPVFTGDGVTTRYPTGHKLLSKAGVHLEIGGVRQAPAAYALDDEDVVLVAPPPVGVPVHIRVLGVPVPVADASGSKVTAAGTPTARSLEKRAADVLNVRDFGAVGAGVSSSAADTAAIDKAFAYLDSLDDGVSAWPDGVATVSALTGVPELVFPAGEYVYAGNGFKPTRCRVIRLIGDGQSSTSIRLTNSVYLIEYTAASSSENPRHHLHFEGIKFVGGKGYYVNRRGGVAIAQGPTKAINCQFIGYTECAMGSLWADDPNWQIVGCEFEGTPTSIGLVLPPGVACGSISRSSFAENRYHIKTFPDHQGLYKIGPNNIFLPGDGGNTLADIWFVAINPATNSQGFSNIGEGVHVFGNRFSNEGATAPTKPRILIADENTGSGADVFSRSHSTAASTNVWTSMVISDNYFGGYGDPASNPNGAGIVRTYTPHLAGIVWRDNQQTWHPYLIELASGVSPLDGYQTGDALITEARPSGIRPSNFGLPVVYTGGAMMGEPSGRGEGWDPRALNLCAITHATAATASGGASLSAVADRDGRTTGRAAEVTFSGATQYVQWLLDHTSVLPGETFWVEIDLQAAASTSMGRIDVVVGHSLGEYTFTLTPTAYWRRVRLPVTLMQAPSALWVRLHARTHYVAGSKTKVRFGHPAALRGPLRTNYGPAGTLDGTWDGGHLVCGGTHAWRDSSGNLRVKNGAPTSATDGVVVGAQALGTADAPTFGGATLRGTAPAVILSEAGTDTPTDWRLMAAGGNLYLQQNYAFPPPAMMEGSVMTLGLPWGSVVFNGAIKLPSLANAADDTAAAAAGVVVGQMYRTGSALKVRIA